MQSQKSCWETPLRWFTLTSLHKHLCFTSMTSVLSTSIGKLHDSTALVKAHGWGTKPPIFWQLTVGETAPSQWLFSSPEKNHYRNQKTRIQNDFYLALRLQSAGSLQCVAQPPQSQRVHRKGSACDKAYQHVLMLYILGWLVWAGLVDQAGNRRKEYG